MKLLVRIILCLQFITLLVVLTMSTKTSSNRIHPFISLRVPCVSLEYCFQTWLDNGIIDQTKESRLRKIVSEHFGDQCTVPDFENLYFPLFCKWSLIEDALRVLVYLQLPDHFLKQYSVDFKVVSNIVFGKTTKDNNEDDYYETEDIPDANISKFHELSFDTLQVLSKIEVSEGMRKWVSIFPIEEVRIDPFHSSGANNKHLQRFKKTILQSTSSASSNSGNNEYVPPSQLVVVKCPSIMFNHDIIEKELCSTSVFMDFETYLTRKDYFSRSVIVLPKGKEDGDTDTTCVFWDVPVWVIISFYVNLDNPDANKPPEVPIFTNVWEVNKKLFMLFNTFMRDYLHFMEEREFMSDSDSSESKKRVDIYCKADHAVDSPSFEKSVTSRLLYRSSVRKNGVLLMEHLISDHPHKREETGQYKVETIKEKAEFIGIGLHSFHFDMEMMQHVYYKKGTAIPFLDTTLAQADLTPDTIDVAWNQACNKTFGRSHEKRKSFSRFNRNPFETSQQKPLFYFFFIWHYSCKMDKILDSTLIVLDNRKITNRDQQFVYGRQQHNDGNISNSYEELKELFSSQTNLSQHYLEYLLVRLVPFIVGYTTNNENESSTPTIFIKVPIRLVVQKTFHANGFNHIESHLDRILHVEGNDANSGTNRLCKMPFWYNDVSGYFENTCKPLFDILRKDKYKFSTITGCFPLDRSLLNYGLVKFGHSDIFADYNYNNILGQVKNLISISLQICKICHIEMKEALFGSKMLWFTRLCEYLCCMNNYPKPNKMKLVGDKNFGSTTASYSNIPQFLSKNSTFRTIIPEDNTDYDIILDEIRNLHIDDKWKVYGGDISEALVGHYTKNDSGLLSTMDYDAFYNSIICEYQLGYICYSPNADSEINKHYISNELTATFSELLTNRRKIKQQENKTQEDTDLLNALKLVGNSIYGCVASKTCPISSEFFANFVTWIGRVTIKESRSLIQRHSPNHVLFSQTDSICVRVKDKEVDNISLLVQEINSKLCQNHFMKLVQEESFSDLFVFNKNSYIAEKVSTTTTPNNGDNPAFYEMLIEDIFNKLESMLNEYEQDHADYDSQFYSNLLIGHVRLKEYFTNTLFRHVDKEYKIRSIFTKKWPLLKKVFFVIMLLCRKLWGMDSHSLYFSFVDNKDIFSSFILFRMKQLVFRIFLQKHPVLLSTLCKYTNGVPQIDFLSTEHFKTTFVENEATDKNVIPFRHLIETCNFIGNFLKTLKGRGFQIPCPWNNTTNESQKVVNDYLKEYQEKGWLLQLSNTNIENSNNSGVPKTDRFFHWWESLIFTDYITNMNSFNLTESQFSISFAKNDHCDESNNLSHLLKAQTIQHVTDFCDFSILVKSLSNINIIKSLQENLILINSNKLELTIPLVFKNPTKSSILFVHDLTILFEPNFTNRLYKDMEKYKQAFPKMLSLKLDHIKHISIMNQKELNYYGHFLASSLLPDTENGDKKSTIEEEMCLLLKTLCVGNSNDDEI